MPIAHGSGVPIDLDLPGSRPPLILLRGFAGGSTTWRHASYVDAPAGRLFLAVKPSPP
jgi:pimeloyl-ACP methyl ester carboxylesterase